MQFSFRSIISHSYAEIFWNFGLLSYRNDVIYIKSIKCVNKIIYHATYSLYNNEYKVFIFFTEILDIYTRIALNIFKQ